MRPTATIILAMRVTTEKILTRSRLLLDVGGITAISHGSGLTVLRAQPPDWSFSKCARNSGNYPTQFHSTKRASTYLLVIIPQLPNSETSLLVAYNAAHSIFGTRRSARGRATCCWFDTSRSFDGFLPQS